ncbi:addiction module toxin, HicA family [Patescibacteria group bacterium]|nr:addiction module toxin, HicA family [Patescibacteria group bacterium]
MPKLIPLKPKQLVKLLHELGFEERDAEGSHVLFRHPDGRTTTVAMKSREVSRGLLRKILHDIDLSREAYEELRKRL